MNICIATLRNKTGSVLKYRILGTDTGVVHDIHSRSIEKYLQENKVSNLIYDNGIICTQGSLNEYPILYTDNKVKNNIPVLIRQENGNSTIANIEGKVVTLPTSALIEKMKQFGNARLQDGNIVFKTESEIVHAEIHKEQPKTEVKTTSVLSPLQQIMQAQSVDIDIQKFDIISNYKKFGISGDVFKKPGDIFVEGKEKAKTAVYNPDAYSFDIVTVEDRVELRKYIDNTDKYEGKVVIPDGVTHICKQAFEKAKCTEIEMPDTVIYLGDYAFAYSNVAIVKLSRRVTAIPYACFFESALEEIDLSHITSIDNMSFGKCKITKVDLQSEVIQIGFEAFSGCTALSEFNHQKTIQKVRKHAFDGCISLIYFDFDSVTTIEQYAFYKTGIKKAKINGEVNYIQSGTFTGDIEEIELLEGITKISAGAVSNIENKPIVWTVPKSAINIEKGAFHSEDTVICYRKSVAASIALIADANIVYIDDLDRKSIPSMIKKANLLNASVEDLIRQSLEKILGKEEEFEAEYEIDESKLMRADIPKPILDLIGGDFEAGQYATAEDIETENIKFKAILDHLSKVAQLDGMPFAGAMLELKDTFNVPTDHGEHECLYDDEKSTVFRIKYVDNKFASVYDTFIVAKTYDTLRYICMDNKYTDIMCENTDIIDVDELIKVFRPGDTLGLNSVISGVRYPEISCTSGKKIQVSANGYKVSKNLEMNLYQALRYSSVTIRLDNNNIVLIIPGNKKIIKCASLGKTVWQNEKEETYKSLQCTIESIEDIGEDTIFDYESSHKGLNYGPLFKKFRAIPKNGYEQYKALYSHIYPSTKSMYRDVRDYAYLRAMQTIKDVDLEFMARLFQTQLFEERKEDWLENSIGKTVVADVEHEFELVDGSTLYQYKTVKKTALRNKLMSGGDKKLYVFELVDASGYVYGVYLSVYDIVTLVNMCIGVNAEAERIFVNKDRFDRVPGIDVIEIAELCKGNEINIDELIYTFIFAVYKPNGLYYIGVKKTDKENRNFTFIPLVQVGELDVALAFIENTNKVGTNDESMDQLFYAGLGAIGYAGRRNVSAIHEAKQALLAARANCIDGISDIKVYNQLGLEEVLKRCMGYSQEGIDVYSLPEMGIAQGLAENDIEMDIDMSDFDVDDDFDISEEDFEDI